MSAEEKLVDWEDVKARDYDGMTAQQRVEFDEGLREKALALEVAQMVYEARTRAGMSQAELAKRAGTGQPAISAIERALQLPTMPLLNRLALAMGTTLVVQVGQRLNATELESA